MNYTDGQFFQIGGNGNKNITFSLGSTWLDLPVTGSQHGVQGTHQGSRMDPHGSSTLNGPLWVHLYTLKELNEHWGFVYKVDWGPKDKNKQKWNQMGVCDLMQWFSKVVSRDSQICLYNIIVVTLLKVGFSCFESKHPFPYFCKKAQTSLLVDEI